MSVKDLRALLLLVLLLFHRLKGGKPGQKWRDMFGVSSTFYGVAIKSGSGTTQQIHYQARALLVTAGMDPLHQPGAELLSQEEGSNQEQVCMPAESDPGKQPQSHDKGHRNMNCHKPLGGKSSYVCPPVSEGDIQDEDKEADKD